MNQQDRKLTAIAIFLVFAAFYLVNEYVPDYLPILGAIVLTYPLVYLAGVGHQKHKFDGYLDYLREVGDLVDNRAEREIGETATVDPIPKRSTPVPGIRVAGQPVYRKRISRRHSKLN